jgi:CRISPR system Cascade subunit CasD
MANILFLRLEGPLQSWGERARWEVRDTAPEPTKSGVVGMLGCALGLGEDAELRALSCQLRLGVRCDRPGKYLVDYHTVVGGIQSGAGKIKTNAKTGEPETVVSHRTFLCDASFLVAVEASPEIVGRLAEAIQAPCWPVYLGRRCCAPSCPPFAGVGSYPSLEAALSDGSRNMPGGAPRTMEFRAVVECAPADGIRRRDELVSRSRRTFGPRYTREVVLEVTFSQEVDPCSSRD